MRKNIVGLILVDAPHSALNNVGMEAGDRTENIVRTKIIRKGSDIYPYVSGQAFRYWWRDTLKEKFNWNMSPLTREKKIVYSEANPLKYDDDDIFGYMRAPKGKGSETVTRISPLKVSPLVSVNPQRLVQDFGTASRQEGDPVPYEHEFYSTVLKGIFSLDLSSVGRFSSENRTGYNNITSKLEKELEDSNANKNDEGVWTIPRELRIKRVKETIKALPYLFGGAMQTRHLTDVSPKLIVFTIIEGGNHLFMNIVNNKENTIHFDIEALKAISIDYSTQIVSPIYIGREHGFMNEIDQQLASLEEDNDTTEFKYGSITQIIGEFTEKINNHVE